MIPAVSQAIAAVCRELFSAEIPVELSYPEEAFGDLSTNIALQLAGRQGDKPRVIAERIVEHLQHEVIADVSVAGPGFINIRLQDSALLAAVTASPEFTGSAGQVVLAEYSDPNAMKPLHAGHLYTTLVGDTITRLLERDGARVTRLNYGGDVGRHVAICLWAIVRTLGGEQPDKLDAIIPADRALWLGLRYAEGYAAFEDDPDVQTEVANLNQRVYQLHEQGDHDSPLARIYWRCRQWSYDYFRRLYHELQVVPFDRFIPESEVAALGLATVREQLIRGVYRESDGAVVFEGEPYGLHTRVFINAAGLPTYEAKDIGLLMTKWADYHFDRSIVITDRRQQQYYQVMLKSAEQFAPEPANRSQHITHGTLRLSGGVNMSSRRGNVLMAMDIIEAATQAAQRLNANATNHTMLAAIKYALAKHRVGSDIVYDPDESIALEGNSGPYLQYAHARACSVLAKAAEAGLTPVLPTDLQPAERTMVRLMGHYPTIVQTAIAELMPHHLCTYIYELAQAFNRFYEHNRVIGDDRAAQRLFIIKDYAAILADALGLLGITAPERM